METRKQLMMTGAFLVVGVLVVIITTMMLSGNNKLFQKSAHLFVRFDQVQGLNNGSVVSLAGLPIGNIDEFEFDSQTNTILVSLQIPYESLKKLKTGTQAEIRTQGALGDKYIYIIPGNGSEALKDGSELQIAKSTDIMAILSEKGNETEKIFEIIKELHIMTKSINHDNKIGQIMNNLEAGSSSFRRVAASAENSMAKFDHVMTKIDRGEGTLGALISDPSIHDQIKNILGGSQRKSQVRDMLRRSIEK